MGKDTLVNVELYGKQAIDEVKCWKTKLTAAFDDITLLMSISILGLFYFAYTFTNYWLGGNTRDQDSITSECSCRSAAKVLYRLMFSLLLIAWFFIYSYTPLEQTLKSMIYFVPKCREAWDLRSKGKCLQAATTISYWRNRFCVCCKAQPTVAESENCHHFQSYIEKVLWFRYYKLYVTGQNCDPEIKLRITKQDLVNIKPEVKQRTDPGWLQDGKPEVYNCCSSIGSCSSILKAMQCSITLFYLIRFGLLSIKYAAQFATVPLLMLQIFDTYALLCFLPDGSFCEDQSEYRIHLVQGAITLSFYVCIAVAQIASILLEWDPLAKLVTSNNSVQFNRYLITKYQNVTIHYTLS